MFAWFANHTNSLNAGSFDFSALRSQFHFQTFNDFHAAAFNDPAPVHTEDFGARLIAPQTDTGGAHPFHSINIAPFGGLPFGSHSAFSFEQHHGWLA
jgi:hypothetical protein